MVPVRLHQEAIFHPTDAGANYLRAPYPARIFESEEQEKSSQQILAEIGIDIVPSPSAVARQALISWHYAMGRYW